MQGSVGRESDYQPFTLSSFQGLGIIRTYLVLTDRLDTGALAVLNIPEYVQKMSSSESESLQVIQGLVATAGDNRTMHSGLSKQTATTMSSHFGSASCAITGTSVAASAYMGSMGLGGMSFDGTSTQNQSQRNYTVLISRRY